MKWDHLQTKRLYTVEIMGDRLGFRRNLVFVTVLPNGIVVFDVPPGYVKSGSTYNFHPDAIRAVFIDKEA